MIVCSPMDIRSFAIDNFITGRKINIVHLMDNPSFTLIEANVIDDPIEFGSVDQIYHLASPASPVGYMNNPIATHLVNSVGTKRMLDLAREQGAQISLFIDQRDLRQP